MKLIDKDALVAEIERRQNFHHKRGNQHDSCVEDVLYGILSYIDTLEVKEVEEEPVSKDYRERYKRIAQSESFKEAYDGKSISEEEHSEIDFEQELYKAFGQVKDFTLGMRIAKWFYDMGKNSQEPVSEELEEAAKERVDAEDYCCVDEDGMPLYDSDYLEYMFKEGANWQKERMLLNNDEYQTVPVATLDRLYASEKKLEQMMKDAMEATVTDIRTYKHENEVEHYYWISPQIPNFYNMDASTRLHVSPIVYDPRPHGQSMLYLDSHYGRIEVRCDYLHELQHAYRMAEFSEIILEEK